MNEKLQETIINLLIVVAIWSAVTGVSYFFNMLIFMSLKRKSVDARWKKASKAFGVRVNKLKKMSKEEIKALYRKMAMKHHPDKGGDAEKFRNLHEAYEFAYAA